MKKGLRAILFFAGTLLCGAITVVTLLGALLVTFLMLNGAWFGGLIIEGTRRQLLSLGVCLGLSLFVIASLFGTIGKALWSRRNQD